MAFVWVSGRSAEQVTIGRWLAQRGMSEMLGGFSKALRNLYRPELEPVHDALWRGDRARLAQAP